MAATNEVLLFSMILIPSCLSRPSGAPQEACPDLTPGSLHSPNAQSIPIPYNLTVSGLVDSMLYIPGQTYTGIHCTRLF